MTKTEEEFLLYFAIILTDSSQWLENGQIKINMGH